MAARHRPAHLSRRRLAKEEALEKAASLCNFSKNKRVSA
jgi:hypothetical protein